MPSFNGIMDAVRPLTEPSPSLPTLDECVTSDGRILADTDYLRSEYPMRLPESNCSPPLTESGEYAQSFHATRAYDPIEDPISTMADSRLSRLSNVEEIVDDLKTRL